MPRHTGTQAHQSQNSWSQLESAKVQSQLIQRSTERIPVNRLHPSGVAAALARPGSDGRGPVRSL